MQFHVGSFVYTVKVPRDRLCDEFGEELEGCVDESRRLILISRRVEPFRREEILRHEVVHAWEIHVPQPRTAEERAQLMSLISSKFDLDFADAGGPTELANMLPSFVMIEQPDLAIRAARSAVLSGRASMAPGINDRMTCGGCGCEVTCGSINNGLVEQGPHDAQAWMERWMICPACDILQTWNEYVGADLKPAGVFMQVPAPRLLRGKEAADFIEAKSRGERVIVPC